MSFLFFRIPICRFSGFPLFFIGASANGNLVKQNVAKARGRKLKYVWGDIGRTESSRVRETGGRRRTHGRARGRGGRRMERQGGDEIFLKK
jgi:hypothetical protein